ncbi:MAG: hypothetical protein COA79_01345 [Planctomycetota bacterium]|nr:MAG: hypothetical protein COA79_01345 [Planctomycetota bacterium]
MYKTINTSEMSDIELVKMYAATSSEEYFSEFFRRYNKIAYRTAFQILRCAADAEDIIQISFIEIIKTSYKLNESSTFPAWLLQIVVCRSKNKIRSKKRRTFHESKRMPKQVEKYLKSNNDIEQVSKLKELLYQLPPKYKDPISLNLIEDISIKEVAIILSKPEKTIRTQISRGLNQLRTAFKISGFVATTLLLTELLSYNNLKAIEIPYDVNLKEASIHKEILNNHLLISHNPLVGLKLLVIFTVLTIPILGFYFHKPLKEYFQKNNDSELGIEVKVLKKKIWDFDAVGEITGLESFRGNPIKVSKYHGYDQSKSLIVPTDTILKINIKDLRFPIKLSYRKDFKYKAYVHNAEFYFLKTTMYKNKKQHNISIEFQDVESHGKIGQFFSENKEWLFTEIYITKQYLDLWNNGKRSRIFQKDIIKADDIKIYVYEKEYIDNLIVEEITISQLPEMPFDLKLVYNKTKNMKLGNYSLKKLFPNTSIYQNLRVMLTPTHLNNYWYNINSKQYRKMLSNKPNPSEFKNQDHPQK